MICGWLVFLLYALFFSLLRAIHDLHSVTEFQCFIICLHLNIEIILANVIKSIFFVTCFPCKEKRAKNDIHIYYVLQCKTHKILNFISLPSWRFEFVSFVLCYPHKNPLSFSIVRSKSNFWLKSVRLHPKVGIIVETLLSLYVDCTICVGTLSES